LKSYRKKKLRNLLTSITPLSIIGLKNMAYREEVDIGLAQKAQDGKAGGQVRVVISKF
jgi:hypothetical protein